MNDYDKIKILEEKIKDAGYYTKEKPPRLFSQNSEKEKMKKIKKQEKRWYTWKCPKCGQIHSKFGIPPKKEIKNGKRK